MRSKGQRQVVRVICALPPEKHTISEGGLRETYGKRGELALGFCSTEAFSGVEGTI